MDRAELERLARECLARIPMPPADWACAQSTQFAAKAEIEKFIASAV